MATIELDRPKVLLTRPGRGTITEDAAAITFDPGMPFHVELYIRLSEYPSVIAKWQLSRLMLRAATENLDYEKRDCNPASLVIYEHPDNGALIRIHNRLPDGIVADPDDHELDVMVDVDRDSLIRALDLLDERAPMEDPAPAETDLDAFLTEVLEGKEADEFNFHVPVHLMVRVARPAANVFAINARTNGDQEVQAKLYRDRSDKGMLLLELGVGHSKLVLGIEIARLASVVDEAWLDKIGHELPPGGVRVSIDVNVLQVPEYDGLDREFDGYDADLRDASIILTVSSGLTPLADFELLLPEKALVYLRLLAKQWASEQPEADATVTQITFASHAATPPPIRQPTIPAKVTTEARGRRHPFAPGDLVQRAKWDVGMSRPQEEFIVSEIGWAIDGDEHPRMRLVYPEGSPVEDNIWLRVTSFEMRLAA